MKNIVLLFLISFTLSITNTFSQTDCKVIPENLKGEYTGKCKKGLAHGKGTAKGIDTYTGKFKNGFPHGKGEYTYQNGDQYSGSFIKGLKDGEGVFRFKYNNRDSIQEGIFAKDIYKGPKPKPDYKVSRQMNIARLSVSKISEQENKVRIKIIRDGNTAPFSNLDVATNGGISESSGSMFHVTAYSLPLTLKIMYDVQNRMNSDLVSCVLEITINNPGSFEISIINN